MYHRRLLSTFALLALLPLQAIAGFCCLSDKTSSPPAGFVADVPRGAAPWIVSLIDAEGKHHCGGVLVAPAWVLTAAICANPPGENAARVTEVRAGESGQGGARRVVGVHVHPGWSGNVEQGEPNLALMRLEGPLPGSPMALPDGKAPVIAEEETLIALGRAITNPGEHDGSSNPRLADKWRYVEMPAVGADRCQAGYPGARIEGMICAGRDVPHWSTCSGDSGAPLLRQRWGAASPELLGLVSWGFGCGDARQYSVHVAVWPHRDWVRRTIEADASQHAR